MTVGMNWQGMLRFRGPQEHFEKRAKRTRFEEMLVTSLPLKKGAKYYWNRPWFRLDDTFALPPPPHYQSSHKAKKKRC